MARLLAWAVRKKPMPSSTPAPRVTLRTPNRSCSLPAREEATARERLSRPKAKATWLTGSSSLSESWALNRLQV
ncbi:hypothetical protein D3C87_1305670 [compost metagenome]